MVKNSHVLLVGFLLLGRDVFGNMGDSGFKEYANQVILDQKHLLIRNAKTATGLKSSMSQLNHLNQLKDGCFWEIRNQKIPVSCFEMLDQFKTMRIETTSHQITTYRHKINEICLSNINRPEFKLILNFDFSQVSGPCFEKLKEMSFEENYRRDKSEEATYSF
jgi:hypothetical protein